jgi:hypothetical protein
MNLKKLHFCLSLLLLSLVGCAEKSMITPLVESKSLIQQFGEDGHLVYRVRLPLTEEMIDPYEDITRSHDPLFGGLISSFRSAFYNLGASAGLGKAMVKIQQVIPDIDPELVTDVHVTKVFFTIDDKICDRHDVDFTTHPVCKNVKKKGFFSSMFNFRKKDKQTFGFIKNAIIHVTPTEEIPAEDTLVSFPDVSLSNFRQVLNNAFPHLFNKELRDERAQEKAEKKAAKLSKKQQKCEDQIEKGKEKIWDGKRCRNDRKGRIADRMQAQGEQQQASMIEIEELMRLSADARQFAFKTKDGLSYEMGKYLRGKNRNDIIWGENIDDTLVIYTNNAFELRNYLRHNSTYNNLIDELVNIRGMIFVKLKNKSQVVYFRELLLHDDNLVRHNISVPRLDTCAEGDCITLRMNKINLVPLIKNKNSIIIDAYFDVSDIPKNVFQLRGYVEFEVKLKFNY